MSNETDGQLATWIRAATAGDRAAAQHILGAAQDRVYRLSLRMLGHPQDAEDAAQEILIIVLTHLGSFRVLNPLLQMPSGVHFSFFGSFLFGTPAFPVSQVPLQSIVDRVAAGAYRAKPARVFRFDEIQDAHRLMDSSQANGKLVVTLA